jgi:hypothetical protein
MLIHPQESTSKQKLQKSRKKEETGEEDKKESLAGRV